MNSPQAMQDMKKTKWNSTSSRNLSSRSDCKTLRRGKWIPEEEEFAAALIDAFKLGVLENVEDGATLRSVLSKKLLCSAMRVSKKYAGGVIGKLTFITREDYEEKRVHYRQMLNKLETKFKDAVFDAAQQQTNVKPDSHVGHTIASKAGPFNTRCFGDVFPIDGMASDEMLMPVFIPFKTRSQPMERDEAKNPSTTQHMNQVRPSSPLSTLTNNIVGIGHVLKRPHRRGRSFETQVLKHSRKDKGKHVISEDERKTDHFRPQLKHGEDRSNEENNLSRSYDKLIDAMMSWFDKEDDVQYVDI